MTVVTRSHYRTPNRRPNALSALAGVARHVSRFRNNALLQAAADSVRRQLFRESARSSSGSGRSDNAPRRRRVVRYREMTGSTRMKNIRRGRKVTKKDPYVVSLKAEKGMNVSAWHCVYVGGTTHTVFNTLRVVCMSLVRFFMMKAKIDFGNFGNFISFPLSGGSAFSIRIWVRGENPTEGALEVYSVTSNGKTFMQLSEDLATLFVANMFSVGTKRLIGIGVIQETTTVPTLSSQYYLADDLKITVKGESGIQVQNRTKGETTGDANEDLYNTETILANPLRGKYYNFGSSRPVIRDPENLLSRTASGQAASVIQYESNSGIIANQDRLGSSPGFSNFTGPVENSLRKPPPGAMFSNCSHTRYLSVAPGEIVKAKVQHTVTLNLSTWMEKMVQKFDDASTKTFAGLLTAADPFDWKLGRSHVYGLEKMCDTSVTNGNEVFVGIEHNIFMTGVCRHKPKIGALPFVTFPIS